VFSSLLHDVQMVIKSLENGDDVDEVHVNRLMESIREAVPAMARVEVAALHQEVDRAIGLVLRAKTEAEGELKRIRKGKNALNGYSHIRGYSTSQRLSRKA
jgi:hypothetical protein